MDDLGVALFMETPMLSSCNLTDFNDDIDHNALTHVYQGFLKWGRPPNHLIILVLEAIVLGMFAGNPKKNWYGHCMAPNWAAQSLL